LDDADPDEILAELARQASGIPRENCVSYELDVDEGYTTVVGKVENQMKNISNDTKQGQDSTDNLMKLIYEQPKKYALCRLSVISQNEIKACVLLNENVLQKKYISISDITSCSPAFTLDEVIVDVDEKKVIGVVRECFSRKDWKIVCVADIQRQGLLRPLNTSLPPFTSYIDKNNKQKAKLKGRIAVYSETLKFQRFVRVTSSMTKLLVVKFLKWDCNYRYPLGIVVDDIACGSDFDSGLKVLCLSYQIRTRMSPQALVEEENALREYVHFESEILPGDVFDYRYANVFTVDSEGAEDLDDAISLEMKGDNRVLLGVHIADVSYFVKKGTCLDAEAKLRNATFYPDNRSEKKIPMLPHKLNTNICSILPNCDRLVISFWFGIDLASHKAVPAYDPCRSRIKSPRKFSYREVDDIIKNGGNADNSLAKDVQCLFEITKAWSLPNKCDARAMIKVLMEKTNEYAAGLLLKKFPTCVPLFIKTDEELVDDGFHDSLKGKDCLVVDESIPTFKVLKPVWYQIMTAVVYENDSNLCQLVKDANTHPSGIWRELCWTGDDQQRIYARSGPDSCDIENVCRYVRMTSPMRRYMDLVTQRLLAALIDNMSEPVYTEEEMTVLCDSCNNIMRKSNQFQQQLRVFKCALAMQEKSALVFPYIERFTDSKLDLKFPSLPINFIYFHNLKYNDLDLVRKPTIFEETTVQLPWQQRVYDVIYDKYLKKNAATTNLLLPSVEDQYVYKIPQDVWNDLLEMVECSPSKCNTLLQHIHDDYVADQMKDSTALIKMTSEISSEMLRESGKEFKEHYVKFDVSLQRGSLLQVQLSAQVVDGLLHPMIQLLCLTPKLDVCIEHHAWRLKCFATESAPVASQLYYNSVQEYQQAWLPVLNMEAATSVVAEGGATIHGVKIRWVKELKEGTSIYCGMFDLEKEFCKDRHISFYPMNAKYFAKDYGLLPDEKSQNLRQEEAEYDFLCIRYHGTSEDSFSDMLDSKFHIGKKRIKPESILEGNKQKSYADAVRTRPELYLFHKSQRHTPKTPSWVGHAIVTRVAKLLKRHPIATQDGKCIVKFVPMITVRFKLHWYGSAFPDILLKRGRYMDCTIEWLPKQTPHQYVC